MQDFQKTRKKPSKIGEKHVFFSWFWTGLEHFLARFWGHFWISFWTKSTRKKVLFEKKGCQKSGQKLAQNWPKNDPKPPCQAVVDLVQPPFSARFWLDFGVIFGSVFEHEKAELYRISWKKGVKNRTKNWLKIGQKMTPNHPAKAWWTSSNLHFLSSWSPRHLAGALCRHGKMPANSVGICTRALS